MASRWKKKIPSEQKSHQFVPFKPLVHRKEFEHQANLPPLPISGIHFIKKRNSFAHSIVRVSAGIILVVSLSLTIGVFSWLSELGVFEISEESVATIVSQKASDNSLVFDRHGTKIGEYFNNYKIFVPFKDLPKHLVDAILAIEDRNFWGHSGYDPKGIFRALLSVFSRSKRTQGASTITQQIVRNFLLPKERSIGRKVQEIAFAIRLEKALSKEKLFEIYTNALFLGNGSYGVGAAARRYFGKDLSELGPHETALIAGLFQSPSRYNPIRNSKAAKMRQLQVINALKRTGLVSADEAKSMEKTPLEYSQYEPVNGAIAPYFVDYVREEAKNILSRIPREGTSSPIASLDGQGLRIYTTLDPEVQSMAENAIADSKQVLEAAERTTVPQHGSDGRLQPSPVEAALLSLAPETGEVLAMIGGRDYQQSKFNRTWQALRSPGSAFKPIVYALALENRWKWSDVIFVSPITIDNYRPHTPSEDYLTETTLLRAFYRSMNTPTVELGQKLGLDQVIAFAKKLGIRSPIKDEFGTLLGSSDATMFDMARVYSSFANSGALVEPVTIRRITDREGKILWEMPSIQQRRQQVMTPQLAYLMTQGMRSVLSMGTGYRSSALSQFAAGKTGTSNHSTDNWFCGYTPDIVSIVWTGTDHHAKMGGDITGGKIALPIWDKFMTNYLEKRGSRAFEAPTGIVSTMVHPKFGHRSDQGVRMYFMKGREPADEPSALEALSVGSYLQSYRDVFTH